MRFSVFPDLVSISIKNIGRIENISSFIYFRHRTCDEINLIFSGIIRHCLPGWAAFFFGINREIFCLIWTAEHFRKNYKIRRFCFYLFYIFPCCTNIFCFIFYCWHLNGCYFHICSVLSMVNQLSTVYRLCSSTRINFYISTISVKKYSYNHTL